MHSLSASCAASVSSRYRVSAGDLLRAINSVSISPVVWVGSALIMASRPEIIPAALKSDSWGFRSRCRHDSLAFLIRREAGMAAAVSITRMDYTAPELRGEAKRSGRCRCGTADAGLGAGAGRQVARRGCDILRHGSADPVRLGASLQCRRSGWAAQSNCARSEAEALAPSRSARWPTWFGTGRIWPSMAWCAGARIDLARVIEQRYGVKLAERSVGDLLRRSGFRRISVRPRCPEQDAAAQEAHKKTLPIWSLPHPRACARQADRALVAGRGPRRPARHVDAGFGPSAAAGRGRRAISATTGPICSVPSVPRAMPAPLSSCRWPTARP